MLMISNGKVLVKKTSPDAELIEKLAELEHDQWVEWSKSVSKEVSEERLKRWRKYWVPYDELTDEVKEQDRVWARKALKIINDARK